MENDNDDQDRMSALPNELLVRILHHVTTDDLNRTRLANRKLLRAANAVRSKRRRPRVNAVFSLDSAGRAVVELRRSKHAEAFAQRLHDFDFEKWSLLDISSLELRNVSDQARDDEEGHEEGSSLLGYVVDLLGLKKVKTSFVEELRITGCCFGHAAASDIIELFALVVPTCKHVIVRDSRLPQAIDSSLIAKSQFRTFKWTNSFAPGERQQADAVLAVVRDWVAGGGASLPCYNVELTQVNPAVVADIFEAWMELPHPPFFSLIANECEPAWRTAFLAECERRHLSHYAMEFEHRTDKCAHMKVHFNEDSCRLFPVLDVPARTRFYPQYSARWFRDFR